MTSFSNTHTSRNGAERFLCASEPLSKRCHRSAWPSRVRRRSRRGAAVTEFAVVAPVFFLMVVGFLEFGRALMVQQVLINASRVGARQAITTSATTGEVEEVVQDYTAGVAVSGVSVVVSPDPAAAEAGDAITVTTSVAFSDVSWMASPWFLGDTTLTASSKMRKEGFE